MNMSVLTTIDKRVRLLYVVIIGMGLLVIGMLVGFISYINSNSANSATTPGTCLPIDKGGTGCDMEELRKQYEFIYTTTKQDTGRTTDDGYIIWGQVFRGTITTTAFTEVNLITGLPSSGVKIINAFGSWWGADAYQFNISSNWANTYASGVIYRANTGVIAFGTVASGSTATRPYEVYLDWTDGTERPIEIYPL